MRENNISETQGRERESERDSSNVRGGRCGGHFVTTVQNSVRCPRSNVPIVSAFPVHFEAEALGDGLRGGWVGASDGRPVGVALGATDGAPVGADDGTALGASDGPALGAVDGTTEGAPDGGRDGASDGCVDGTALGASARSA